jgi:aspartokinase/homoserine dehydrogenase 1
MELKYCSLHYSARPKKNIPIHIKNTFEPEAEGTYISNTSISNGQPVKGISHIENITLITLEGRYDWCNRLMKTFEVSLEEINVIFYYKPPPSIPFVSNFK